MAEQSKLGGRETKRMDSLTLNGGCFNEAFYSSDHQQHRMFCYSTQKGHVPQKVRLLWADFLRRRSYIIFQNEVHPYCLSPSNDPRPRLRINTKIPTAS